MPTKKNIAWTVYSDGACQVRSRKGGWGALIMSQVGKEIVLEEEIFGSQEDTTSNRMELYAIIAAYHFIQNKSAGHHITSINFYTDSRYVQLGATDYLPAWKARNWKVSSGHIVKNLDLWQQIDQFMLEIPRSAWFWVKGHDVNPYNHRAHLLATRGMQVLFLEK